MTFYDDATLQRKMPAVGTKIREYELIEMIGRGGMATVYKARHTLIDQIVAVKIMNPALTSDPQFCERFLREAKTQAKLAGHQNIVSIHNFIEEEGFYIIIMEYVDGIGVEGKKIRTLGQQISYFGAMDVGHFRPIFEGVISGLGYAHNRAIIHRDIKPSNIMFSNKGVEKLADFGIAQIVKEQRITRTGFVLGTPRYMSPEQIQGKKVDARSDIYALGITAYEALTGRPPFEGDTDYEIMRKQTEELPIPPREFNPRIPGFWEGLVLWCIAKDPAQRPQSTGEILKALHHRALPEVRVEKIKSKTHKAPPRYIIPAVLGIILFVLIGYLLLFLPGHKEKQSSVTRYLKTPGIEHLLKKRFLGLGKLIAHSSFIADALIMRDTTQLNKLIYQLAQDEPEIKFICFTDRENRIIATSDRKKLNKIYDHTVADSGVAEQGRGQSFCYGFAVNIQNKKIGAVYFDATYTQEDIGLDDEAHYKKYLLSMGKLLAHSDYVVDAFIMKEEEKLNEVIQRLCEDEPEINFVCFTDENDLVIASNDSKFLGKVYNSTLLDSASAMVRRRNRLYEGGFAITKDRQYLGALYFGTFSRN